MSKDIDAVAASVPETTNLTGVERIYIGAPTGSPNVSQDGWTTPISLSNYNPGFSRRATAATTVTVLDSDINGAIDCTANTTVTIIWPSNLTKFGTVIIRKSGTGNVVMTAAAGATLEPEGGLTTITTVRHGATGTSWGSLTNFWVQGCEA